jgi:uncharacterized protein with PIN domain
VVYGLLMYKIALTEDQKDQIVSLYVNDLVPAVKIGKRFDRCKVTIYAVLHERGVDLKNSHKVFVECDYCRKKFWKYRAHYKRTNADYCSRKCRGLAERKVR